MNVVLEHFEFEESEGAELVEKTHVSSMLKRGDKVYTQIVKNYPMAELMPIIKEKADLDAVLYSYGFKTYEGFADYRYKKYYRINQSDNEFAKGFNHINGIENFWGT